MGGRLGDNRKPKLAVYKFTSCDGCQLSLLNLEDHLLELADVVEIALFREARRRELPPPYDLGLVEGSVSTEEEAERIRQIRRDCKMLVTIGACATSGGIQALRNWSNTEEYINQVYATPKYVETLDTSTPIAAHTFVDFELRGCPINSMQALELISALLAGRRPNIPTHSVCVECKRQGIPCVWVSQGKPCLGPITQDGCGGALCPAGNRECYGCFGPMEQPNIDSLTAWFKGRLDQDHRDIMRALRTYNGYMEPFKTASDKHERLRRSQQNGNE